MGCGPSQAIRIKEIDRALILINLINYHTRVVAGMFATCLGLFSLTILNEGLKSYRLHRVRHGGQSGDEPSETAAEEAAAAARANTERTLLLLTSTGRGHNSGSMSSVRRRRIMQESKDFER